MVRVKQMFFIAFFGVDHKQKHIGTYNNTVCPSCGALTRYEIYKSYTYFHIFLIPTFRWNVKYIVKPACCGHLFELDPSVGRAFAKNPNTEIRKENMKNIYSGEKSIYKYCHDCKKNVHPEYRFCPYCGGKL